MSVAIDQRATWLDGLLPAGVERRVLTPHADGRGTFTELFREEWNVLARPVQWNMVRSEAGVFRGVHVHRRHTDYLLVASGRMTLGLRDLRPSSVTHGAVALATLSGELPAAIVIPPGVAHGFLFHEPSIHLYAVTHYWDPSDEYGCHWKDPELGIPWPKLDVKVHLSTRDAALLTLRELAAHVRAWDS